MCLNRKRWQPGSVRFGPSAWKAEQLSVLRTEGPKRRGFDRKLAKTLVGPSAWKAEQLGPPDRGIEATCFDRNLLTNVS